MSSFKEGQIHQLANSLETAGFTAGDITRLGQSPNLRDHRGVLRRTHEITPISDVIDLESPCILPFPAAKLADHYGEGVVRITKRDGDLFLNARKITLFLSEGQQRGKRMVGLSLFETLDMRCLRLSANVLDYLVEHPSLWPESWKKRDWRGNIVRAFFWGDIFEDFPPSVQLLVRCGYWSEGKVITSHSPIDGSWDDTSPAASLKG